MEECFDCGELVASDAEVCPHCGSQLPNLASLLMPFLYGFVALVGVLFLGPVFTEGPGENPSSTMSWTVCCVTFAIAGLIMFFAMQVRKKR